jgi:hypothetical protein
VLRLISIQSLPFLCFFFTSCFILF